MDILGSEVYLEFFLTIAAVLGVIIGATRYANKKLEDKISQEIKEATRPIHPLTNGGVSLADLHRKIDKICEELKILKAQQIVMERDLDIIQEMERDGRQS